MGGGEGADGRGSEGGDGSKRVEYTITREALEDFTMC